LDLNVAERFARQALVLAKKDPIALWHARYRVAKILFLQNKLSEIDALYQSAKATEIAYPDAELRALRLEFAALQMEAQNALGKTSEAYVLRSQTLVELTIALKQEPNSADLQEIALRLQRQEANDQLRNNQTQAALETISTAIASARASVQDNPNNARLRLMTKRLLNLRAQIYRSQKEIGAELLDLRESVRLLTEISARDPEQLFLRAEVSFANRRLSEALLFFANASEKQGQVIESNYLIEAQKAAMASVDIDRGLLSLSPTRPFARRYLSSSLEQLGLIRRQQMRLDEALMLLRESLQVRLNLAEEFPVEFAWFHLSAISYSRLKDLHIKRLENTEALSAQRNATEFFHKAYVLAADGPTRFEWFNSSLRLAEMAYLADQTAETDAIIRELQAVVRDHAQDFVQRPDLISDLQRIVRQRADAQ
jgi:tetratricopeptide (TPR) repeat protein